MNAENMIICERCGAVIVGEAYETHTGHICDDCREEYCYEQCDECGKYDNNLTQIPHGWRGTDHVCNNCLESSGKYFYCDECERWRIIDWHGMTYIDDEYVCDNCYEEYYESCHECGGAYRRCDMHYDDYNELYYCDQCWSPNRSTVNNYSYKPDPVFKTRHDTFNTDKDIKDILMGVENEIDNGDDPYDTAAALSEASSDVYIKHDGSLGDNGLEIVTHPCTLDYHMHGLGWDDVCKVALESNYRSHDARTCGLHVHVGRWQLGENEIERDETIARIIVLVDRFWEQMVRFSRRRPSQIRDWAAAPNLCIGDREYTEREIVEMALNTRNRGRYQAINLTNLNTIEFRLFNGTLKVSTIMATLQLVSNICRYAKDHTMDQILKSTWSNVANYIVYGELLIYLKERGLKDVENPSIIYLKSEDENNKYCEGDIVHIVNNNGLEGTWANTIGNAIGKVGRIVKVWTGGTTEYLVSFMEAFAPWHMITEGGNRNCLWITEKNISRLYRRRDIVNV